MHPSKRFVDEVVELSRDCELGQEGERAIVTALWDRYMTLTFPDRRALDDRDVHTGADYKHLRAYEGPIEWAPSDLVKPQIAQKLTTPVTRDVALRELRALVATYLEGSDDAARAAELLDVLNTTPPPLALAVPVNDDVPMVTKARNGAWTPWAQVLCVECEYAVLKNSARGQSYAKRLTVVTALARMAEVEHPDGNLLASCAECRCKCWVRDDVALLQQVGFKSAELDWEGPFGWALQQTGGMCAALVFSAEGRQIVVTAMDGAFYVGEYAHMDGVEESWERPLRTWESASLYLDGEMKDTATLKTMTDECALKVIEFTRNKAVSA